MKRFTALANLPEVTNGLVKPQRLDLVEPKALQGRPQFGFMLGAPNFLTKRQPVTIEHAMALARKFREEHPELIVFPQGGGQVYGDR